jgi:hypothetical protein
MGTVICRPCCGLLSAAVCSGTTAVFAGVPGTATAAAAAAAAAGGSAWTGVWGATAGTAACEARELTSAAARVPAAVSERHKQSVAQQNLTYRRHWRLPQRQAAAELVTFAGMLRTSAMCAAEVRMLHAISAHMLVGSYYRTC